MCVCTAAASSGSVAVASVPLHRLPPPVPPHAHVTQAVIEDAFRGLYGRTLNFNTMVAAVGKLNRWYEDRGVLGQVRRCQGSEVGAGRPGEWRESGEGVCC